MAPRSSLAENLVIGGSRNLVKTKKVVLFIFVVKMTEFMVIFGSEAESRPEWTRMVDVVYGSDGGELGFPSVAQ